MQDQNPEYDRLIAPIQDRMMRCVWRIVRDPVDAEDAFQDALLSIWKHWDQVGRHPNPHALILRMCIHAAHDMMRRRSRRLQRFTSEAILPDIADPRESADRQLDTAQFDEIVLGAIGKLSRNQAQVILMHAVEKLSYADIALAMGCREATVRKHAARARTRLRALLAPLMSATPREEGVHA